MILKLFKYLVIVSIHFHTFIVFQGINLLYITVIFLHLFVHGGGFFLGLPPPLQKFLRAPMIASRVREHAPPNFFLCDRNLVSSGYVLLRFCLKNDKNNDKLYSHVPARWVGRYANLRKMLVNGAI